MQSILIGARSLIPCFTESVQAATVLVYCCVLEAAVGVGVGVLMMGVGYIVRAQGFADSHGVAFGQPPNNALR